MSVHFRPLETLGVNGKERWSSDDRWKDDGGRGQVIESVCGLTTGIVNRIERAREDWLGCLRGVW